MSTPVAPRNSMTSNRVRTIAFVIAVIAAAVAGYLYRSHHRYKNVAVHEPGVMHRSAWVEPDVMDDLIRRHRIRTVINLCTPGELGEHRWAVERESVRNAGAQLLELPMSTVVDPHGQDLGPHLAVLADRDNYPMLVHCKTGLTRTSKFLAIYDICFRGKSGDESLADQPLFGNGEHDPALHAFCRAFEKQRTTVVAEAPSEGSVRQ